MRIKSTEEKKKRRLITVRVSEEFYQDLKKTTLDFSAICRSALSAAVSGFKKADRSSKKAS